MPLKAFLLMFLAGCPALSDADLQRRIDRDGDGAVSTDFGGPDCDDLDVTVRPGAPELCDGVDNDCDGQLNADDPDMPVLLVQWYLDADRDGVGRDDGALRTCATPSGYVHTGGDCDDTDPDQKPGQTWFLDGDGDGWGLTASTRTQCERPVAHVLVPGDCLDANNRVNPGLEEVCNTFDDDCDAQVDDADPGVVGVSRWFPDGDGDGYGAIGEDRPLCFPAETDVLQGLDCDDSPTPKGRATYPGAPEIWYDGNDSDCSGGSDYDQDGDTFDAIPVGDDCDDVRSWVHVGAADICDGLDNACLGVAWDQAAEREQAHFVPTSGLVPTDYSGGTPALVTTPISEDGTLYLCERADAWTGTLEINGGTVAIVGLNATATIDSSATGTAIHATGAATHLSVLNVDLVGGTGFTDGVSPRFGGCIFADDVASVTLRDTTLSGCSADSGGGAWLHAPVVDLFATDLIGNSAADNGGGLHLDGDVTLARTELTGNTAARGGGVFFTATGMLEIDQGAFTNNDATVDGDALQTAGDTRCEGTAFQGNDEHAIFVGPAGSFDAVECTAGPDGQVVANAMGEEFPWTGTASFQCSPTDCVP